MFEISIDENNLKEIDDLLESGKLTHFLAENTVNIESVAFILQAIVEKVEEARNKLNG